MNTDNPNRLPGNPTQRHSLAECGAESDRRSWGGRERLARFFCGVLLQADPQSADEERYRYKSAKFTIWRVSAER